MCIDGPFAEAITRDQIGVECCPVAGVPLASQAQTMSMMSEGENLT